MKEIKKALKSRDVKEMYTLLKNKTDKELSFFIDSSFLANQEIFLKYCLNNDFTLDNVKKDYDTICRYLQDEMEYNEICELFEDYRENVEDNITEYKEDSLTYYYLNLERNRYKENALKDSGYLELTFEDLDY